MAPDRKIFLCIGRAICFLALSGLSAQTPPETSKPEEKEALAQDPLNRLSPQSSVVSFLETCRSGNFERAARYLNLDRLPRGQRLNDGPRLAQQLGRLLDRDAEFDVAALSKDSRGDLSDGLPEDRERVGSWDVKGKTLELQLERRSRRAGLAVWTFSSDSVDLIPQLVQMTSDSTIERYIPTSLVAWNVAGTPVWRWIALALLIMVVVAMSRKLSHLAIFLLRPLSRDAWPQDRKVKAGCPRQSCSALAGRRILARRRGMGWSARASTPLPGTILHAVDRMRRGLAPRDDSGSDRRTYPPETGIPP